MPGIIVSDASCLILLQKLNRLDVLRELFNEITITEPIEKEFGDKLPDYFKKVEPKDKNYQRILERFLDAGEASAIALALENEGCLLMLDDQKARKEVRQMSLRMTGTIGILLLAIEKGLIESGEQLIYDIQKTNFRISDKYLDEIKNRSK
jgi:predicted nucleic acid-binding protein